MAENDIVEELSHKKVSSWRRLAVLIIDGLMVAGLTVLLFYTLGSLCIQNIAKGPIDKINEIYATECVKRDDPYKPGMYGIYQLDKDGYINKIIGTVKSYDEAVTKYTEEYSSINTAITKYEGYSDAYKGFAGTYYGTLLITMLIPSFLLLFIVPVLNKRNKTISMFITKTSLVKDDDNVYCSKLRVFARFFVIYAIEIALAYVVGQYIAIGLVFIGNIVAVCFTKKKKAIHDLFTKIHVEKDEFSYTPEE